MGIEVGGLLGLLVLVANVWAIVNIIGSPASVTNKVIWTIVILLMPVIGLLIWLVAGPRSRRAV
ncbi:MAG TPA: PLD nuclease N-terminal domain-containing protein [Geminicoccaceae bacterium]|nr:PLD nuclease N-terminal domain-containing protein [Geminicoccaceae bacterium]